MALNHDLSDLFRTMAAIMEIKGEPVFKAIAFSKVSRILGDMTIDLREAVEKGIEPADHRRIRPHGKEQRL
jgi:DNA polymerase/3'-5' exonuclease PolX